MEDNILLHLKQILFGKFLHKKVPSCYACRRQIVMRPPRFRQLTSVEGLDLAGEQESPPGVSRFLFRGPGQTSEPEA